MRTEEREAGHMRLPAALAFVSACCLALTITPQPSYAATAGQRALKARLEQVAKSHTTGNTSMGNAFMGTVLVTRGDNVLLNKGYGKANLAWSILNSPDARFRLGSLTKQFTAALVLLLQEEGKLRIQDPVTKYLPDAPKQWAKDTLAELLHHTSGIPNFTSFKDFVKWSMTPRTHAEELAFFRDKPLDFKPGSKFEYSNSNYEVLGVVIEKVSGKSYGDLLRERILKPLHMNATGLDTDGLILPKRAQGYWYRHGRLMRARSESMTVPWAAGSMYSTTGDLLRWEHALFGGRLLSAASLRAMTTPGKGHYGLGVEITRRYGMKVISHSGGIEGFNTYLAYVPARKIAVVVLGNVNGTAPIVMGNQLLDVMLGKQVVLASERKPVPLAGQNLTKFAGSYALAPDFTLTFVPREDELGVQANGPPVLPLFYEGVKGGHPYFYWPKLNAQIEFIAGTDGKLSSIVMHANGNTQTGKREDTRSAHRKK